LYSFRFDKGYDSAITGFHFVFEHCQVFIREAAIDFFAAIPPAAAPAAAPRIAPPGPANKPIKSPDLIIGFEGDFSNFTIQKISLVLTGSKGTLCTWQH